MKCSQSRFRRSGFFSETRHRRAAPPRNRGLRLEPLEERALLDAAGPSVLLHTPTEIRNAVFDHIDLIFDEAIDSATFTLDDIVLEGPGGPVAPSSVTQQTPETYRVSFPDLSVRGNYTATIGPEVADLAGNPMDQNGDGTNGDPAADFYEASLVYINATTTLNSNVTITEGDATYDGEDLLIDGATVAIDGPHSFNSIHLVNGGVVTHSANTTTETHKLDLTVAEQIILDATSSIDVTGKGYLPGYTVGNTTDGGSTDNNAGSYGGMGGGDGGNVNNVYGEYADPSDWGSGGSTNHGSYPAGAGGGLARIVTETFRLDGTLAADGASRERGGGSGGSIYVSSSTLTGDGFIHAAGGNGVSGGGGGRVAVYAADYVGFAAANVTAVGGIGTTNRHGGAGTVYLRDTDELRGTLIVDAGMGGIGWTPLGVPGDTHVSIPDSVVVRGERTFVSPEHDGMPITIGGSLTVDGAVRLTWDQALSVGGHVEIADTELIGTELSAASLAIANSLVTTFGSTAEAVHKLELNVSGDLVVDSTSTIDVSGKGYVVGRTVGNSTVGGATGTSGGTYGGLGGSSVGVTNSTYGDYADPNEWGSGGGPDWFGSSGGGLVRITADGFTLDGQILANGPEANNGGGSGGGILVTTTTLSGDGEIHANGGVASNACGGGGRIAIYASDYSGFDLSLITSFGARKTTHTARSGAGTVYIRDTDEPLGTLIIDNGDSTLSDAWTPFGLPGDTNALIPDAVIVRNAMVKPEHPGMEIDFGSSLSVQDASVLTWDNSLNIAGHMTVADSELIGTHLAASSLAIVSDSIVTTFPSTIEAVHKLELNVSGDLALDSTSTIDVNGKGYLVGRTVGNTTEGAATGTSGGSYGGLGGSSVGVTNSTYGDYTDPNEWGSGGGPHYSGSSGGGLARITSGAFTLDGQILANGADAHNGAGSGGGILVVSQSLTGSGEIQADGGSGPNAGGGGGRIAVYAEDYSTFDTASITAWGGVGGSDGSEGTIYILQGRYHTRVRGHSPEGTNAPLVGSVEDVLLYVNKPLDHNAFEPEMVMVDGPLGPIDVSTLTEVAPLAYRLGYVPPDEQGYYHFSVMPSLVDADGFQLDQNANGIPGEPDDFYQFTLVLDTVAPHITTHTPAGDITGTIDHVDVWFSEEIDKTTFTTSDVLITTPDGPTIPATSIEEVGLNRFRVGYAPQTAAGIYQVEIGPDVTDLAGNPLDQDADGVFGEPTDDTYLASINLVEVDLEVTNISVDPAELWAGEAVTISWEGSNATGAPLLGDWTDGIYLSADGQWDIGDIRLVTAEHTGGLAQDASYSASANAHLPAVLPDQYYFIVRSDVFNEAIEGAGEANNVAAWGPADVVIRELSSDGTPIRSELSPDDREDLFQLTVGDSDSVEILLDSLAVDGVNEVLVSFEAIPTRFDFDHAGISQGDGQPQDRMLALTAPTGGGTFYIRVYAAQLTGPRAYDISANVVPLTITSISPDRGVKDLTSPSEGYARPYTLPPTKIHIAGAGFNQDTVVEFIGSDGSVWPAAVDYPVSTMNLIVLPDTDAWPADVYDVRLTKGGEFLTQSDAFTLLEEGASTLETELILPSGLRTHPGTRATIWIEYENVGDASMYAPLLRLTASHNALLTIDESLSQTRFRSNDIPPELGDTIEMIVLGEGLEPGVLEPGERGRIPVWYRGLRGDPWQGVDVSFTLGVLTADAISYEVTRPTTRVEITETGEHVVITEETTESEDWSIGWDGPGVTHDGTLKEDLRPEWMPSDAWEAIWENLALQIGADWGGYVERIAEDASYSGQLGEGIFEIPSGWNFEVAKASASLNPVSTLASAVDASLPAPGMPLVFSRVYGQTIPSRYELGPMGRGWTHNWDIYLTELSNGDIVIHGPNGALRFFQRGMDGDEVYYAPLANDYSSLSEDGGVFKLTENDKTVWQFLSGGKLDYVEDTNGNRITADYAGSQLTTLTHSGGGQLFFGYSAGLLASVTNPLGPGAEDDRVTTFDYTGEYLTSATAPGDRVTLYTYETGGTLQQMHALLTASYPDGTADEFTFDERGRLTESTKSSCASCESVTYTYGPLGQVTVTDATGRETLLEYGLHGLISRVTDGNGETISLQYTNSRLTELVGPGGERYEYTYDGVGNITEILDPLNYTTSFDYNLLFDQLSGVTDPRDNGIDYQYDTLGNLESIVYEDGTHEDFTYDTHGNILTWTNRRLQTVTYTYNPAGQLTTKDYPETAGLIDYVYTYDTAGNLTSSTGPEGTTGYAFDPVTDDLLRIDYPGGQWFEFDYDEAGRRTRREDQDANVVNYGYDNAGRLDVMTDATAALIVDYDYGLAGRLQLKTLGNGVYTTYDYDDAGNLLHLINYRGDDSVLSRFDYTYDASGRRTSMTTLDGTEVYGYDRLGQLTSVEYPDGRLVTYRYDGAGNRITVTDSGSVESYATNDMNQYTSVGGATYTFDDDGNMTSKTEGGVTTTYTYNIENRLAEVSTPTDTWTYVYDALGNRIASTHNGDTTHYLVDPIGLGNVAAEFDESGAEIARYDHGLGLLARTDAADVSAYYTFSAIGNTSEMTGPSGSVLNSYSYDPFGTSQGKSELTENAFEFVGEFGVMNEASGLEFMRARHYLSDAGRFLQPDPLGPADGPNLYLYARNSPVELIDPSGLIGYEMYPDLGTGIVFPHGSTVQGLKRNLKKLIPDCGFSLGDPSVGFSVTAGVSLGLSVGGCIGYPFGPVCVGVSAGVGVGLSIGPTCTWGRPLIPPKNPTTPTQPGTTPIVNAWDPNDKLAPVGYGDEGYIQTDTTLPYQIRFENMPEATAPAQRIVITDTLDADLDLTTFQWTEIAFGDYSVVVPPGLSRFDTNLPITADGTDLVVEIHTALDLDTRELTISLEALDPATGWWPEDPFLGLLYPNDETHRGEGHVSYVVRPLAGLPSGTEIHNRASIVFDYNDPIETPLVLNTLDAQAPTSSVAPLAVATDDTTFDITWSGQDKANGSGLAVFDIYISVDGGPYVPFAEGTTDTSATVTAEPGHTYAFCSLATDNAGHRESWPSEPDAVIRVRGDAGITVSPTLDLTTTENGGTAEFTVVLDEMPTSDVEIIVTSQSPGEGLLSIGGQAQTDSITLVFHVDHWSVPQTVAIAGVDDAIADGDVTYTVTVGPVTSDDTAFAALDPDDVEVTNTDDDSSPVFVVTVDAPPPGKTVSATFTEPMAVQAMIADGSITAAISIVSLSDGPVATTSDQFTYDPAARTLTWSSAVALTAGCYRLRLDGSLLADEIGNLLVGGEGGLVFNLPEFAAADILQSSGADLQVNSYSVPSLADWNNDGLMDLIVGEKTAADEGKVRVYLNSGTEVAPVYNSFTYARLDDGTDAIVPGSGCLGAFPQVLDWDGDGKKDLVIGRADGQVQWFPNTNTDTDPRFGAPSFVQVGETGLKADIDVGDRAALEIVDWNNDGQADLVTGAMDGKVRVYLNEAAAGEPDFRTELVVQDTTCDLVVPTGRSSVVVLDLDGDGRKDLLAGNTEGQLLFYANIGTDTDPAFDGYEQIEAGGVAVDLPGTPRSRPFVGDYNGDGVPDLLVGAEDGLVRLYVGTDVPNTDGDIYRITGNPGETYSYTFCVPFNIDPVADAGGPYEIAEGAPLALDASGSFDLDPGQVLSYVWTVNGAAYPASMFPTLGLSWADLQAIGLDDGLATVDVSVVVDDGYGGADSAATTLTLRNAAPTADLGNSGPVNEGGTATVSFTNQFDPSPADRLSGYLYSYDFGNDGSYEIVDSSSSSVPIPAALLADGPGTLVVSAQIKDKDGGFTDYTTTLQIDNVAPVANAGGPYTAEENTPITFVGSATDAGIHDTLIYEWNFGYDGVTFVLDATGQSVTHTWSDDYAANVALRVTDKDGASHIAVTTVTVTNVAPLANAGTDQTVDEGGVATFSALATDQSPDDQAILTYNWDFGDPNDATPGSGASPSHAFADNGVYTVRLTVADDDGGVATDELEVTVNNVAPVANAGGPYTAEENEAVAFTGSAEDAGSLDTLTYEWDFDYDGATFNIDATGQNVSHTWTDDYAGNVALRVTDKDGDSHIDVATVTVTNVNPTAEAGTDQTVDEGDTVHFAATADDQSPEDAAILTYSWDFGDPNDPTPGSGATPSHVFADNGIYTVTLTVVDDDGGETTDELTVTVSNVTPVADAGGPYSAEENMPVTFLGSGTDVGTLDTLLYEWDLNYDGVDFDVDATGASVSQTWTDDHSGDVALRVTDKDGASRIDVATVTVTNVDPIADAGDDQAADEGDTVHFAATATDQSPEDQAILTYAWDFGDVNDSTPGVGSTASHLYADNGVYTVTLTVYDDDGGVSTDTLTVTVNNVAPVATAGGPYLADENVPITLIGTATDVGTLDTLIYEWDLDYDGTTFHAEAVGQNLGHTWTDDFAGQVALRVTDKDGGSHIDAAAVSVVNVDPVATAGDDQSSDEGQLVQFAATATDQSPDDQAALTYTWDFGDPNDSSPGSGATPAHTYADNGTYTVILTVTDDDGGVATDELLVTVSNAAPVVTALSVTATGTGHEVDLSGAFTDAGVADTHTCIVDWGDGSPTEAVSVEQFAGHGSLTATHNYPADGEYTVTVTVTDSDGEDGTASTTVNLSTTQEPGAEVVNGVLRITGTDTNDHVLVGQLWNRIFVIADFLPGWWHMKMFDSSDIERIEAVLGVGHDTASLAGNVRLPALLDGGPGNDLLNAGRGDSILLGGHGNDILIGGRGSDILIGGLGQDRLIGCSGDDILIGGTTAFDANNAALLTIMDEWSSGHSYATRVKNIRGTEHDQFEQRLNAGFFLIVEGEERTVFDDNDRDRVTGSSGWDWFFANLVDEDDDGPKDKVTDLKHFEMLDELEWLSSE